MEMKASDKPYKGKGRKYSAAGLGILIAIFICLLVFVATKLEELIPVGLILGVVLLPLALVLIRRFISKRWKMSDKYSLVAVLVLAVIWLDFLLFIGPGEVHWIVFVQLLGGPITAFFIPGGSTVEFGIVSLVVFAGIISYLVWPRWWTMIITIISIFFWWVLGMALAFVGV